MFPIKSLPNWLTFLVYLNPLTYGVDGLRGSLVGLNQLPLELDLFVLVLFCIFMVSIGTYLFETTEVD